MSIGKRTDMVLDVSYFLILILIHILDLSNSEDDDNNVQSTSIHLPPLTRNTSNSEIDDNDVHDISIHMPLVSLDSFELDFIMILILMLMVNLVSKSDETQQSINKRLSPVEDVEYFIPEVSEDIKPKVDLMFDYLEDGISFYKRYVEEGGFNVSLSTQRQFDHRSISRRYVICSRSGFGESSNFDSVDENQKKRKRRTASKKVGCPANVKFIYLTSTSNFWLYVFVEEHNHKLVSKDN
ncbi:hypothetical protein L1887_37815 [Cichorium endivia]|nr:hypothetical protein L1887_37815 [Cichorium endivia]